MFEVPAIVSSSAAISEPSCKVMRWVRKNSSPARSTNGSSQPSSALRRITCTSWLRKMCGTRRARAHDVEIGRFQRPMAQQPVAERDHHLPVLARIGIRDRGDLVGATRRGAGRPSARHAASSRPRRPPAGGAELRPRQIDLEKLVGHDETAARVAVEQMMAAGEPEILHGRSALGFGHGDQIDLVGGLFLAFDLQERERAHRLAGRRADAACGRLRASRRSRTCDAPRSACRADGCRATRRTRPLPRRRRAPPRCPARRNARPAAAPAASTTAARSASLASTICTRVDQPSDSTPRNAPRNAERALPSSCATSAFQNTKAPDTAHSPGSAARSNTNVSDGSSRMVRSSFTSGPRVFGSSHDGAASSGTSFRRSTSTLPMRRTSKSPFSSMSRRSPLSRGRRCTYSFATAAKPYSCQASLCTIRCRAKLSTSAPDVRSVKPSCFERRRQRIEARLGIAHRDGADHRAEHQPGRRLILARTLRPGDAAAADQAAVDADRIRPLDLDHPFRRRIAQQRVGQRDHAQIERAPRGAQRLVGLQHDGELGEIEAAHIGESSGALLGRDLDRMREGIADLAQGHQAYTAAADRGLPRTARGLWFAGTNRLRLLFLWINYK